MSEQIEKMKGEIKWIEKNDVGPRKNVLYFAKLDKKMLHISLV